MEKRIGFIKTVIICNLTAFAGKGWRKQEQAPFQRLDFPSGMIIGGK